MQLNPTLRHRDGTSMTMPLQKEELDQLQIAPPAHDLTGGTGAGRWNAGTVARQKLVHRSAVVSVEGPPAHALFHCNQYLVDNIEMKIRVDLNSDAFALISTGETEKIKLVGSTFVVRFLKISDKKREEHIKKMSDLGGERPQPAL